MGNDLRERLEALSAAVSRASFTKTSIAFLAETEIVLRGALQEAYNRGELVTRSEMEEAVAQEREACTELCEERADVLDDMGIEMECCVGTANNCADDIRARSEQKEGE